MLLWVAVLAAVVLRALLQPLPAPVIAEAFPGAERVPALARQATWRDIGAGTGPLAAGVLFPVGVHALDLCRRGTAARVCHPPPGQGQQVTAVPTEGITLACVWRRTIADSGSIRDVSPQRPSRRPNLTLQGLPQPAGSVLGMDATNTGNLRPGHIS